VSIDADRLVPLIEGAALIVRDACPPRALAVVLAAALASLWPAPARAWTAPPERVVLHWAAPSECPAEGAVRAEMDRLLGPSSARPPAPIPVAATVSLEDQGEWHVRLETPGDGAPRIREIHAATCAAIADATALILAMMIDPEAASAAPPSPAKSPPVALTPPPIAPPRVPVEAPRSPPPPPPITPPPATPTSLRIAALAGLDTASLPELAASLALGASFVYGAQRFEAGIAYYPSRKGTVAARPGTGGNVDLLTGSVGTCRHFGSGAIEVGPCVGVELGRLHASGFGVSNPGEGSTLWAAVQGGGVLSVRIVSRLALVLRLGATAPLLRPSFVLENVGAVYRPPAVTARGSGGVELIF
jgi:hypothetical protein